MSMTKINDENSDNEVPKSSTVIFPGQSHISRGITVLIGGVYNDETEYTITTGTYSKVCFVIRTVVSR